MAISLGSWQQFSNNLMQDFQTQYGAQSSVLNYLTGILKPMLEAGGQGFSPQTLAAMRTGAADTTAQQYQNAAKALQTRQAVNGGAGLPSGVNAQQQEELAQAAAGQNATAQENISMANEQQRERNLEFGTNALMGIAGEQNPLGYAGAADNAGRTQADIENANTQQDANSFTGSFKKGIGSSLGSLVGTVGTMGLGGVSSMLSGGGFGEGAQGALYGG